MERIRSITEFENEDDGDGFKIVTNQQTITLAIDNHQGCCENWGYFMSEDDLDRFIGANLRDVTVTDTALNTKRFNSEVGHLDEGDALFVNFDTSRGKLQFVAYNAHNGYYGHRARIESTRGGVDVPERDVSL